MAKHILNNSLNITIRISNSLLARVVLSRLLQTVTTMLCTVCWTLLWSQTTPNLPNPQQKLNQINNNLPGLLNVSV